MKKIFIVLSNLLMGLFFVWTLTTWSDTYVSFYYPNISVFSFDSETTLDKVADRLSHLADQTDSLIAIQHQEPGQDGRPVFSYTRFGKGALPDKLSEKPLEKAQGSDFASNYFIFHGSLTAEHLQQELQNLGMTRTHINKPSYISVLTALFNRNFQMIVFLVFLLIYGALSLIGQILNLRTAGIRLISGEKRKKIFLGSLSQDMPYMIVGIITALFFALIAQSILNFSFLGFHTIGSGLIVYNLFLLLINLFFASLFAIGIKKIPLMEVIKGKVPVRGIISLVLIGQLLAIIIVSIGVSLASFHYWALKQHLQGEKNWQQESHLVQLALARGGIQLDDTKDEKIQKQKIWFNFVKQAISEEKALFVRHNLSERVFRNGVTNRSNFNLSTEWNDYSPEGNVLTVTPLYLKYQQIEMPSIIDAKLNHLQNGEFVLILPERLRSQEQYFKKVFEENVRSIMSGTDGQGQQDMVATIAYLENGQDRFIYNNLPISYQHFLRDPIIVVLTPESTGDYSYSYWENGISDNLFFDNLHDAQELIREYGLDNWVAELESGYHRYQSILNRLKGEMWGMFSGAVLGLITSILLFNTMNRLYFEEFRRTIFIKRIAGLRFLEMHRNYLLAQLLVFLIGFLASILLNVSLGLSLLVLLFFIGLSVLQLHYQMKKENQMSMLILKGG